MNVFLWIAAGALAAVALVGGIIKTFVPRDELARHESAAWTRDASPAFVKALGVLEILAAIGLIVPAVTDIAPVMVPITALFWIALMVGAMVTHARLRQPQLVMVNVVYLAIAAFIAIGRFGPESFTA